MKEKFKDMTKYFDILAWINEIQDEDLRLLITKYFEDKVPEYFWTKPASSSGRHHPIIDRGDSGLVNHTKMVCLIAHEMLPLYQSLEDDMDIIYASLLIHDSFKYGLPEKNLDHTIHEHPILSAEMFREFYKENSDSKVTVDVVNKICDAVKAHHGQWSTSKYSQVVLPKPTTDLEYYVHMCDYIASREFIGNFDLYNE